MQYNTKSMPKATALYARFSRNDSDNESDSIANQRKLLESFALEKGFTHTKFYADDGISGTTFERPDFKRLLCDIESGEICTVIVKDLSRLGRLNAMVSYYTELYFPQNSIRFIAIYDNVDSENGENEFAPFKNIFNEWYARDTSNKIRAVLRNKGMNGGIMCSKPPYGYRKDPDDKNHWLIDEEAAETVRLIFRLFTEENNGLTQISRELAERGIVTPAEYFERGNAPANNRWNISSLRLMLQNRVYLGDVINFKTYRKSYKDHKMYMNDPENYVIYRGKNDPIISEEQFERAQEIIEKGRRIPVVREPDLFQGFVYCADCGKRMSLKRTSQHNSVEAYYCNSYRRDTSLCTAHYVRRDILEEVVLQQIREMLYSTKINRDQFTDLLRSRMSVNTEKEQKQSQKELIKLCTRCDELDKIISKLYEDRVFERISEERYFLMVNDFESQQNEVKRKIEELQKTSTADKKNTNLIDRFVEAISKYDDIVELDQFVLLDLVDKILIGQRTKGQDYSEIITVLFKEIGDIFFEE